MLSVMNDNVYLDSEIKGFDKNDDRYSEDNRHKCVDNDVVVDSSGDVIGNGETRVGDLNLGGTVDRMDVDGQVDKSEDFVSVGQMDVDAKVEKREEFGSVNKMSASAGAKGTKMEEFNGASSRLELDDGFVREADILNDVGKGKNDETKERPGKRFEKSCVGNGGSGMVEKVGGYEIGDMVWGKVKSHPWWPGQIYNEELASPAVRKTKTAEGCLLVAFFGDCSFGWFHPTELIPFDSSYAEKSQQPSSRIFVKAIEEAVDEASRRCSLGLACRCRNAYSFLPTTVPGYLSVDFGDHENGTIYSVDQIRRSRDDFQPIKMLNFVNQLALSPVNVEHKAIDFVKNKATALAYRKAVYEEFDETYAQAFGYESERPRVQTQDVNQPPKAAAPAPLSGPLVIAEVLHKGKGSAKSRKSKDHGEKDQFLFKRRDEPNGLKASVEINRGKAASSKQPVYEEGSLSTAATEHAIQKNSAPVSTKHKISAKHHRKESSARDKVSDPRQKTSGKGGMTTGRHSSMQFSHGGSPMNLINSTDGTVVGKTPSQLSHSYELNASLINEKDVRREIGKSSKFEVGVGLEGINTADSADDKPCPIKLNESFEPSSSQAAKTKLLGEQGQVGCVAHPPGTDSEKSQIEGRYLKHGIQAKKVKVRKQPTEGLNGENSAVSIKKKRKKEILSSKNMKMPLSGEKVEAAVGNMDKLPVHGAISSRENLQLEPRIKEDKVLIETNLAHNMSPVETTELELPQLLHSLQSLAREFTLGSSSSTTFVRQAFLKYRSLVFEKSLAILPDADSEPADLRSSDHAAVNKTLDIPAADVRERLAVKPHRQVVRPDDPSKGGRKRGPSDRQEEIVAKKKKKLSDMKVLTSEKKATQKFSVIQQADGIEEASQLTMKSIKPAPLKKPEPSSRTSDPLMLVMKFPPQGTLPSIMELKARFARFGQLDHSATRIFWKTSTCRLVYRHRADAESACKHVSSCSNLFGNTDVKCYTREVEIASSVNESGRAQKEDSLMGTSQLRDSVEQRPATSLPSRTLQQPGGQLRSILKKSNGDDAGATNGGGKKTRVKFILGEEETNRAGEQSMIGNKNMNNNVVFVDGGTSSSTSHHGMDINSKNIVVHPPPLPMLPIPTAVQYQKPPNYMHHHTELAPRNTHNFNVVVSQPMTPIPPKIDISQQMMGLLIKCNDVVNKLTDILGYLPLHPL